MSQITIIEHAIRVRAYELWIQRGCPVGSPECDWLQAEQQLRPSSLSASKAKPPAKRLRRNAIVKLRGSQQESGVDSAIRLLANLVSQAAASDG